MRPHSHLEISLIHYPFIVFPIIRMPIHYQFMNVMVKYYCLLINFSIREYESRLCHQNRMMNLNKNISFMYS